MDIKLRKAIKIVESVTGKKVELVNNKGSKKRKLKEAAGEVSYYFKAFCDVYEDDYEEGEGGHVNSYKVKDEVSASSLKEALKEFVENSLYFTYYDGMNFDDISEGYVSASFLVNSNNEEASENEIDMWELGELTLYSCNAHISCYVKQPVTSI